MKAALSWYQGLLYKYSYTGSIVGVGVGTRAVEQNTGQIDPHRYAQLIAGKGVKSIQ